MQFDGGSLVTLTSVSIPHVSIIRLVLTLCISVILYTALSHEESISQSRQYFQLHLHYTLHYLTLISCHS